MKRLFIIGGAMGVGKTAVGQQMKADLPNSVFLDGDWCWDAAPFQVTEETRAMVLDNICHVLNNFLRCSAYENVIFCWVLHEQALLDAILGRLELGACRVSAVSLIADEGTLRGRLEADVAAGLRGGDVIERSLARLPMYQALDTAKVDTVGRTVAEVAREIEAI